LRVAARPDLDEAVITTGISHRGKPAQEQNLREIHAVMRDAAGVRRTGAASIDLSWVAQGRFDGYWERHIQAWDMAAGIVLVREAGGYVSDTQGRQNMLKAGEIVCGNEAIHAALLKRIAAPV
jgi:myo-inositol-1(or 4)-monophosphatase